MFMHVDTFFCRSFGALSPGTNPSLLHPNTNVVTAKTDPSISSPSIMVHTPPISTTHELESEEYVTTDVFRADREAQEEIDVSTMLLSTHEIFLYSLYQFAIFFVFLSHSCAVLLQ